MEHKLHHAPSSSYCDFNRERGKVRQQSIHATCLHQTNLIILCGKVCQKSVHARCLHQTKPDYTLRQGMSEICTCQVFVPNKPDYSLLQGTSEICTCKVFVPNKTWLYFVARYVSNLYMPRAYTKPSLIILCGKVRQQSVHATKPNLIILWFAIGNMARYVSNLYIARVCTKPKLITIDFLQYLCFQWGARQGM
jgi:hypothetical protein